MRNSKVSMREYICKLLTIWISKVITSMHGKQIMTSLTFVLNENVHFWLVKHPLSTLLITSHTKMFSYKTIEKKTGKRTRRELTCCSPQEGVWNEHPQSKIKDEQALGMQLQKIKELQVSPCSASLIHHDKITNELNAAHNEFLPTSRPARELEEEIAE